MAMRPKFNDPRPCAGFNNDGTHVQEAIAWPLQCNKELHTPRGNHVMWQGDGHAHPSLMEGTCANEGGNQLRTWPTRLILRPPVPNETFGARATPAKHLCSRPVAASTRGVRRG